MQWTIRVPHELATHLKAAAAASGRSLNSWVVAVLSAAVDPDYAGSEADQIRARLRRAGLLVETDRRAERPPSVAVAKARRAAGKGRSLSELVSEERR